MASESTMVFTVSLTKHPQRTNERHFVSEDDFIRLSYFLQSKETSLRLERSCDSKSVETASCSSPSVDSRPVSSPSSRILFTAYWEKTGARKAVREGKQGTLEHSLPYNNCIYFQPCRALMPTTAANVRERRRQILPTFSDKNETPVWSHATTGSFSLQHSNRSIDGISWPRSSMKTYPKSSFRRVEQKRRGSKLKRTITFDPDVQIVEYRQEEVDTSSDSWIFWFQ